MHEILGNPIWGGVQAIVAVLAFFGMYHIALWRRHKSLSYGIDMVQLLNVSDQVASKVRIEYEGSSVNQLYAVSVKVANTGRESIREQDYISPLELEIQAGRVLNARIIDALPSSLRDTISLDSVNSVITLGRIDLLEGEWFEIMLLLDSIHRAHHRDRPVDLYARIEGVKQLNLQDYFSITGKIESRERWGISKTILWVSSLPVLIAALYYFLLSFQTGTSLRAFTIELDSLLLGIIFGNLISSYAGWLMGRIRVEKFRRRNAIRRMSEGRFPFK